MRIINLIPFVALTVYSCHGGGASECSGKQVSCPSFNDPLALQWVPYKMNEQLIFKKENITDTFFLEKVDITRSYERTVSGSNPNCTSTADFYSSERLSGDFADGLHIGIENNIDQYTSTKSSYVIIELKTAYFSGFGFSDTGLIMHWDANVLGQDITSFYTSLHVGNNSYQNVQVLQKDTSYLNDKINSVYKIWLCKSKGIIAYEEFPKHNLWMKQ